MTIVPALANAGVRVTMLQRSPRYPVCKLLLRHKPPLLLSIPPPYSYVLCRPDTDPVANFLGWLLPAKLA
jgi:hypothetical protein